MAVGRRELPRRGASTTTPTEIRSPIQSPTDPPRAEVQFHPNFPIQDPNALWTFDGTLPPKLLQARYGESIMMRHYNALPVDPAANMGFGIHTLTTHEHNDHNPAESDGYTQAFFFPGQFHDHMLDFTAQNVSKVNAAMMNYYSSLDRGNEGVDDGVGSTRDAPAKNFGSNFVGGWGGRN